MCVCVCELESERIILTKILPFQFQSLTAKMNRFCMKRVFDIIQVHIKVCYLGETGGWGEGKRIGKPKENRETKSHLGIERGNMRQGGG